MQYTRDLFLYKWSIYGWLCDY